MRFVRSWSILGIIFLGVAASLNAQATPSPDTTDAIAAAKTAAEAWLRLVDNGDYEGSWDSASAAFQGAVSKSDWTKAIMQARAPFEPFGSRAFTEAAYKTNLPGAPAGEYVILQYTATVAGARTVLETIVPMKEQSGKWRVSGYYVRPK